MAAGHATLGIHNQIRKTCSARVTMRGTQITAVEQAHHQGIRRGPTLYFH